MNELWIVGEWEENKAWNFVGVFSSEKKAIKACTKKLHFIGPAKLDYRLPDEVTDWVGAYYPLLEKESRIK